MAFTIQQVQDKIDATYTTGSLTKAADVRVTLKELFEDLKNQIAGLEINDVTKNDLSTAAQDDLVKFDANGNLVSFTPGYLTDLSGKSTDDLSEGAANLYFTDARAQSALSGTAISQFNNDSGYLTKSTQLEEATITGDGSATEFTVSHTRGRRAVKVEVLDADTYDTVGGFSIGRPDASTVKVTSAQAIENNKQFIILIL